MKSPKVKGIGEVVTEYGAKVMKIFKKGLLGRSLFDFYGDVKAQTFRTKESASSPSTPSDGAGGVMYTKGADGKLYYKSNEVAEVELSSHTGLTTEEVQDISGALAATGGTKTGITVTYQDATGDMDFVVDHDAASNFVAAEHVDWAGSSTGTVHSSNIPTLNQNTSGTAAGLSATLVVGSGGTGATTLAANSILTGNGTSAVQAEAGLSYDSEILTIGDDDNGTATITRKTHSDDVGGRFAIESGDATGTDKAGGVLYLQGGNGTGDAVGGSIVFKSSAAGASGTTLRSSAEIAVFDNVGNLQIDGDLTVTGNDIKDSGGNSIISSDGSGVVTMAGGNIAVGGSNANLNMNSGSDIVLEADNAGGNGTSAIQYLDAGGSNRLMLSANSDVVILSNRAANGTIEIRANDAAGSGGEVTVATFTDTEVTLAKDLVASRRFAITSTTDGNYSGDVVYFGGTTSMTVGRIYNYKSDGTWEIANADAVATSDGLLAVALGAASDTNGMLLRGMVTLDHDPGAVGDVLYVQSDNAGTLGHATVTAPSASGDCVRIVGYCLNATHGQIWFNPDSTFVEVS